MQSIGWIGVGIMGGPMVRNLLKAGFEVHITARNRAKVEEVIQAGGRVPRHHCRPRPGTPGGGHHGGVPPRRGGGLLCPGEHSGPGGAGDLPHRHDHHQPHPGPAPGGGGGQAGLPGAGRPGDRRGTWEPRRAPSPSWWGGEAADFAACRPLFATLGTNITHQGPAGCGQHAKLANQIMIAGTLSGLCEALAYAQAKGLDREASGRPGHRGGWRPPAGHPGREDPHRGRRPGLLPQALCEGPGAGPGRGPGPAA